MATNLTRSQLKPIFTILEAKKQEELSNAGVADKAKLLMEFDKKNEERIKPLLEKLAAIETLTAEANAIINTINGCAEDQQTTSGYSNASDPNFLIYNLYPSRLSYRYYTCKMSRNSYDEHTRYNYKITAAQEREIEEILAAKRRYVDIKYATIEAQIMLSTDFKEIKDILSSYGISLASPVVHTEINAAEVATKKITTKK